MPRSAPKSRLVLRFLGEMEAWDGATAIELPRSRRTRALLAYLALTERPHSREHLCELLWDDVDDPGAGLRASLDQLSDLIDRDGTQHVRADRDAVAFEARGAFVDVTHVRARVHEGLDGLATEDLEELAGCFRGELLAGLELADRGAFDAWCAAQRASMRELHASVLRALAPRRMDREPADDAPAPTRAAGGAQLPFRVPMPPRGASFPAPRTRYARSGDVSIAYQVAGDGPDLVFIPGWVSNVEHAWEEPSVAGFLHRLRSFCRLLLLDRRGTGLSDRVARMPTLEERMDDIRAVMDAAGSERAAIFGISESGPLAMLFAATYPERTSALALYGTFARGTWHPDYPWRWTEEQWEGILAFIGREWGTGKVASVLGPSIANDPRALERWGRFERLSVSPGGAQDLFRMMLACDVRHVLPTIHTPTLVLQRTGDQITTVAGARYIAQHIPGAIYREFPGHDHFPWTGDQGRILDAVQELVTGARGAPVCDRVLATVLFVDIVGSTARLAEIGDRAWRDLLGRFRSTVRSELTRFRGREVGTAGDSFLATFDGPARALHCARAIRDAVAALGLAVRSGVHTGECELIDDTVAGIAVHIGARISSAAGPNEILASSTVKDLVAGSGLAFSSRGMHSLAGVPDQWMLYRFEDD